jgi:hypothetical protein
MLMGYLCGREVGAEEEFDELQKAVDTSQLAFRLPYHCSRYLLLRHLASESNNNTI